MRKTGEDFRTIWQHPDDSGVIQIIDQRWLPHEYRIEDLRHWKDGAVAIRDMLVRGAPLIGGTAAWSLYLAARELESSESPLQELQGIAEELLQTRPTAVNLRWAVDRMLAAATAKPDIRGTALSAKMQQEAMDICDEDVEISRNIGLHGRDIIAQIAEKKAGQRVNILTHCNAGALATINFGTALAPIYFAQQAGIDVHVWVDETRPRNQGSQLTAWELAENEVPHTLIVDNAGGHLMQHGEVDLCIVGTDRTTRTGDVANKIGTYLKALAAFDNNIPFYVALPSTTIDWTVRDGIRDIPIEQRDDDEVRKIYGRSDQGLCFVDTVASDTAIGNYAFDVTPARLVTGLITEAGVCEASEAGLSGLFPNHA